MLWPFGGTSLAARVTCAKVCGRAADALTAATGLIFSVAIAAAASAWAVGADSESAMLRGAAAAGAWVCALGAASSDGADVVELLRRGGSLQVYRGPRRPESAQTR
jgi:hypothetical protein